MKQDVVTFGVDLAKNMFQVHTIGADGEVLIRRQLRRAEVLKFFSSLSPELARAYADAEIVERRIGIAQSQVDEAGEDLRVARALVGAGKEARLRQLQAETELNTIQAEMETACVQQTVALVRLSALAGVPTSFTGISESLLDRLKAKSLIGPIDPMQATTVRVAEAERDAPARAVRVQQRLAIPNVTAQVWLRQLRAAIGPTFIAGITVPLPFFDRNRSNIAAARADLQGAEARV